MKNFNLVNADTDSITVCKQDQTPFSEEEQEQLLKELNSLYPPQIKWEDDGYYRKVVVLKVKNYITLTKEGKLKIKGSALKATGKPEAMKEMIKKVIDSLLNDRDNFLEIYNEYVKEAAQVKDMKRWASRKTISDKTLNSERTNETRIKAALEGSELVEGDRCYVYFKDKETLQLVDRYDGQYDTGRLLQMCYDTMQVFSQILDTKALFVNYKLKKNHKNLTTLIYGNDNL